ncbi:MAG: winged helix-turn-helix transcriptional regulator [Lachnospiraceae bacterium]|nr:winged helix-turn-helix transcriptional regulator [Lachnospiraceae bacterium]
MDLVSMCFALSDTTRFRLLELLLKRDYCVRALSRKLGISESAVSQHLKVFKQAGLLTGRKFGYHMHYTINRQALQDMAAAIEELSQREREKCTRSDGGCDEAEFSYCQKYGDDRKES